MSTWWSTASSARTARCSPATCSPRSLRRTAFAFASRTVLINNVDDRADAQSASAGRVQRGAIDRFAFVADRLDAALASPGLTRADLGRVPHYTDGPLVAVTLDGRAWLALLGRRRPPARAGRLDQPSIALMERDRACSSRTRTGWTRRSSARRSGRRATSRSARASATSSSWRGAPTSREPIYGQRCLALYRYPLPTWPTSSRRAWTRTCATRASLRATYRPATYVHPAEGAGTSYPAESLAERVRGVCHKASLAVLRASPLRPRCV